MISRVWAISKNIFCEGIRQRVLMLAVVFAIALVFLSVFLGPFSLGEISKIIRDFGLAVSSLLAIFIIITIGAAILYRDIERRTIYTIITRPIKTNEIILGKFIGLSLLVIVLVIMTAIIQQLVIFLFEIKFDPYILIAPLISIFEIMIMVGILLLFSSFSSSVFSSIMTIIFYIVGHMSPDLKLFADTVKAPGLKLLTKFFYYILPNLENFNLRTEVVYHLSLPRDQILFTISYGFAYTILLICLSVIIFEYREFK